MFALADCNNFYASCERLFAPRLEGRPVVVLSSNDGCVIARSNEAKALGIPMGTPFFKIKPLVRAHGVAVFSSNFALYGDLSRRVFQTLSLFAPDMEIYSIDECFLELDGLPGDLTAYCQRAAATVKQWTGIPVSIGIAPTKTLAKLANHLVKKRQAGVGAVLDWAALPNPDGTLASIAVEDIWGIASRSGAHLRQLGIATALELQRADLKMIRRAFGVVMERVALELRGVSCLPLESVAPPRQQIMVSRSFGAKQTELVPVQAAVAGFAARAGEKLREQGLRAGAITVFLRTSPFDTTRAAYANAATLALDPPTRDSRSILQAAQRGLGQIFRKGYLYQKAGVLLDNLIAEDLPQPGLFDPTPEQEQKSARLMGVLDRINRDFGAHTLRFASEDLSHDWRTHSNMRSPASTTSWADLPVVRAG